MLWGSRKNRLSVSEDYISTSCNILWPAVHVPTFHLVFSIFLSFSSFCSSSQPRFHSLLHLAWMIAFRCSIMELPPHARGYSLVLARKWVDNMYLIQVLLSSTESNLPHLLLHILVLGICVSVLYITCYTKFYGRMCLLIIA